jgi:hypothetical protein
MITPVASPLSQPPPAQDYSWEDSAAEVVPKIISGTFDAVPTLNFNGANGRRRGF